MSFPQFGSELGSRKKKPWRIFTEETNCLPRARSANARDWPNNRTGCWQQIVRAADHPSSCSARRASLAFDRRSGRHPSGLSSRRMVVRFAGTLCSAARRWKEWRSQIASPPALFPECWLLDWTVPNLCLPGVRASLSLTVAITFRFCCQTIFFTSYQFHYSNANLAGSRRDLDLLFPWARGRSAARYLHSNWGSLKLAV